MPRVCPTCGATFEDASAFCPTDGSALRPVDDGSSLIGSIIADRYLVLEELGVGGMGRVYLAQHVRIPQRAAIKVLHASMSHDPDALARFNREAANASQINHQHVARVYDFGEAGGGLTYLAMEYVPGENLARLLERDGAQPPARVARLVAQIAQGLDAAHRLGIVHRDLKPDNVLVAADDDGGDQVKVVDFGIAKAMDAAGQGVTRTGSVIGTAMYMSPEQVSGRILDRRSDVYALGLVAFVLLTGTLPFEGATAEEAMIVRLSAPPRTLREVRPDLEWPAEVQAAIDGALARDLNERFPTAGAFAGALSQAIAAWIGEARATPVAVGDDPPARHGGQGVQLADAGAPVATSGRRRVWLYTAGATLTAAVALVVALQIGDDAEAADSEIAGADTSTGNVEPVPPPMPSGVSRDAADSGGSKPVVPSKTAPPSEPDPAPPPVVVISPAERDSIARARLDRLVIQLRDSFDEHAARAVRELPELLPSLLARQDSLRVANRLAGVLAATGRLEEACATLRRARPLTSPEQRLAFDVHMETIGCP